MKIRTVVSLCAISAALTACGGGGGGGGDSSANPNRLAPGTYKLTFTAISTARLAAPISGIDVAVRFPAGISVSTVNNGATGQITSASVAPGSALQTTSLAFGNYSASTRTAYLSMATTQNNYRGGQFLNLLFTVAEGTSITSDDIYALNTTYPNYKVVGLDAATNSSVTMTESLKTMLGVGR